MDPAAWEESGGRRVSVRAPEVEGDQRQALWEALTAQIPAHDTYQAETTQRMPAVVLERPEAG